MTSLGCLEDLQEGQQPPLLLGCAPLPLAVTQVIPSFLSSSFTSDLNTRPWQGCNDCRFSGTWGKERGIEKGRTMECR